MGNSLPRTARAESNSPSEKSAGGHPPGSQQADEIASPFRNNPGTVDELHKKCKDVFPICFDGSKVMINKGLSSHFQIMHTLGISPTMSGYRFGVTYVGNKKISEQESYPVLLGDTDLSGNLSATMIHHLSDRIRVKMQTQIAKSAFAAAQLTAEYRADCATSSLTVANPDLVADSGLVVASYLRRVAPRLDLGVELVYQHGRQIPGGQLSVLQYAGRYTGAHWTLSGTGGSNGLHVCYYHKQQANLQFGVEWETNRRMQESVATFGYQVDMPKANLTFRASIDTNWTVGAVLEKRLAPMPFTLALSGMLNHAQQRSRFGIGLIVG